MSANQRRCLYEFPFKYLFTVLCSYPTSCHPERSRRILNVRITSCFDNCIYLILNTGIHSGISFTRHHGCANKFLYSRLLAFISGKFFKRHYKFISSSNCSIVRSGETYYNLPPFPLQSLS